MAHKRISERPVPVRLDLEPELNTALEGWASAEGRSKRHHALVLVRRLTRLRKTNLDDLVRLGLATVAA